MRARVVTSSLYKTLVPKRPRMQKLSPPKMGVSPPAETSLGIVSSRSFHSFGGTGASERCRVSRPEAGQYKKRGACWPQVFLKPDT